MPRWMTGFGNADDSYGTYLGYEIKTLSSYNTPYYYADGPSPLGSTNHFQTIRQLKNYMDRKVKAGKLRPRG